MEKEYAGPTNDLNIRCCLSKFTKIVGDLKLDLSPELEDSPFRFLLNLKGYELDIDLIKKLVGEFNVDDRSLNVNGKEHVLRLEDFNHIIKIGNKGLTDKEKDEPSTGFDEGLFLGKNTTTKDKVCMYSVKRMLKKNDNVDNFKRAFALLCLRYVVCAPTGMLGKNILKYVERVHDMKHQPWAGLAMHYLVKGISSFKNSKGAGRKFLGGSMVFLQLYYYNKSTNKDPEKLIEERTKSSIRFDNDIMSGKKIFKAFDFMEYIEDLKLDIYKLSKNEDKEIAEEMDIEEGVQEAMREHEDKEIAEEMDIEEGVQEAMREHVGPFRIRRTILSYDELKHLEKCFKNGEDSMILAGVEDAAAFSVTKEDFWKSLSPEECLSNNLINHVTEVLNIRQICSKAVERWYFPTHHRNSRIRSGKSKLKHRIKKEALTSVKQIFFPLLEKSHWYMIVFNKETEKVEIWDSWKSMSVEDYETGIKDLSCFLDEVTNQKKFQKYTPTLVGVPQQTNPYDCGVYVCRSMEYPDEVMKFHTEEWVSEEQRCLLAVRILRAPENSLRAPENSFVKAA